MIYGIQKCMDALWNKCSTKGTLACHSAWGGGGGGVLLGNELS